MNNPPTTLDIPRMQLFELLTKRGWIGRIDAVFAVLTVITPILLHWRYSDMAPLYLLLSMMAMMQVWLIVLAYRVAYFAVIIQVSLDNMPATSARLAVRFLKGGTSSSVPSGA